MINNGTSKKKAIMLRVIAYSALVVILLGGIRFILPSLVFMPAARLVSSPETLGYNFEDVYMTTSDNLRIPGWYIPAPKARATLLFFHGNAGNISHRLDSLEIFHELGLSVLIVSYRGFGRSEGSPTINGTRLDALAAWSWLTEYREIPADRIVVFGRSLGGAVAMELMRSATPGALILESTFSSLADMSPFPSVITPILLGADYWNSEATARSLTVPTLVIHSQRDEVVPFRQGRRVYEAIAGEKFFFEIIGDHNSGFLDSYDIYVAKLDSFLTSFFGERETPEGDPATEVVLESEEN